jgi:hypothetical protein
VKNGLRFVTVANTTCTALLTERTFIREEARPVLHAVQILPVFATSLSPAPAPAGHHRSVIRVSLNAPLVLRV